MEERMNSKIFTRLALIAAFAMTAIACENGTMRAKLPKQPEKPTPPVVADGCPEALGIWGKVEEDGTKVPVAVLGRDQDGNFIYTNVESYKEIMTNGQNSIELSKRDGSQSPNVTTIGKVTCEEGKMITEVTEIGPTSSLPDRVTKTVWSFDDASATGNIEITLPSGEVKTDVVVKIVIEDQEKE
jgi:hypothetical protein